MKDSPPQMAWVIVRIDTFQQRDEARFTAKELVATESQALDEVRRLNTLNNVRGAQYFAQAVRVADGFKPW